ncbi:MAG: ribulose-phosphate 3-epimerase [Deltaproteobacteria bacterium]|nr:ribulose-phosphate 3-epimerase [Deltaproteobacteria bacterium]
MTSKKLIAPSILSADFARLGDEVKAVEAAGADWIHVDVMDGHFVPNITIGPVVVESLKRVTKRPLDCHLMIENPDAYVDEFVKAGAAYVTVHQEAVYHLHRTVSRIRDLGAKAGVSINPATPVETLTDILPDVDLVLIMTVNPGFGGQKFIDSGLAKIEKLANTRRDMGLDFLIEVDGGISESTASAVSKAGCDVFVAGSAIFKAGDYAAAIQKLRARF